MINPPEPNPTVGPDNKIYVKFSCKGCGIDGHLVAVPQRNTREDVVRYLNDTVMPLVGSVHRAMSPTCHSKRCDVSLPIDSAGVVGLVTKH